MDVQELLESMLGHAGARTIFGEPVTAEGKTVIPVAKVRYGFGMGSGRSDGGSESGGGGGGLRGTPVGVVEITAAGTRFIPVFDVRDFVLGAVAGLALGLMLGRQ